MAKVMCPQCNRHVEATNVCSFCGYEFVKKNSEQKKETGTKETITHMGFEVPKKAT